MDEYHDADLLLLYNKTKKETSVPVNFI